MSDNELTISSPLYLVSGREVCWRCHKPMPILALLAANVAEAPGSVCTLATVMQLPKSVLEYVQARFPTYQLRYSKTVEVRYYANTCPYCKVLFGDHFLSGEPGDLLFPTEPHEAAGLEIEEIPLENSISVLASYGVGVGELILENAKKVLPVAPEEHLGKREPDPAQSNKRQSTSAGAIGGTMPILDIQLVLSDGEKPAHGLAQSLADAAGDVFGTPGGRTWVRLHELPRFQYAENGGALPDGTLPVFVTVLKADVPSREELRREIYRLTQEIARVCERPAENVHVLYEVAARGRIAFGGRLVG